MLDVLEQNNLAGKIHFVGFDCDAELGGRAEQREKSTRWCRRIRRRWHTRASRRASGQSAARRSQPDIDSGVQLITRDNLDTPEVQKLLSGG